MRAVLTIAALSVLTSCFPGGSWRGAPTAPAPAAAGPKRATASEGTKRETAHAADSAHAVDRDGHRADGPVAESAHRGEERERGLLWRLFDRLHREPYALDEVPRYLAEGERIDCGEWELTTYRGDTLQYRGALRVHPAFVERLGKFEQIANDTAVEIYGRAPRRVRHAGTYNCRTVRGRARRISEHALGNALDLKGFDFGPLRGEAAEGAPEDLPRSLRRGFTVTVGRHWDAEGEVGERHRLFLRTLAARLGEERVFRGMIGPSNRQHTNHLHLDAGPYRYNWL